jgi:tetratricopeptide (TPR) repeat protein/DNA-binding CsgD family transcriptional regulator
MATNPEIRAILERSYAARHANDKSASLALLSEARGLAVRLKNREFLSEVENAYANHHSHYSEFELELKHRRRAVALLGPKGHPVKLAIARSNLAGTLIAAGEFAEALKHLYRALDHYTGGLPEHTLLTSAKPDEATYLAHTLYSLANLAQNMRNFAAAKQYLELQSEILRKFDLPADPDAFGLLTICHYEAQDYENAKHFAELQLRGSVQQGNRKAEAMAHSGLAVAAMKRGELEQARMHNRKAREISESIQDSIRLAEVLCNQAEVAMCEGDHEQSRALLMEALEGASHIKAPDLSERIHRTLSTVLETLGDYRAALKHYKLATELSIVLTSADQHHEVARLREARMRRTLAAEKKLLTSKLKASANTPVKTMDVQRQLLQLAPTLSRTELKVCELLTLGASTKEIAEKLCASRHTVDGHRTAIRKKLRIASEENLSTWLMRASITAS